MAGEIASCGCAIYYAPESTLNVCPNSGWAQKAAGGTLNIADYVTGISGLTADLEKYDVTPLSTPVGGRRSFIPGLYGNDGAISLGANINPTSRADWGKIVAEADALTDGKSLWFEFLLPGEDKGWFIRATPLPMQFPDVEVGQAVQGTISLVETKCTGWGDKRTETISG